MIHMAQYEFAIIRNYNDIRLIEQDCSKYLFPINNLFMVDFDLIPVRYQILNLSRFWELTFVCFKGKWKEMIDAVVEV